MHPTIRPKVLTGWDRTHILKDHILPKVFRQAIVNPTSDIVAVTTPVRNENCIFEGHGSVTQGDSTLKEKYLSNAIKTCIRPRCQFSAMKFSPSIKYR